MRVESPSQGRPEHISHSQYTSWEKDRAFQKELPALGFLLDTQASKGRCPHRTSQVRTCCSPPKQMALAPLLSWLALFRSLSNTPPAQANAGPPQCRTGRASASTATRRRRELSNADAAEAHSNSGDRLNASLSFEGRQSRPCSGGRAPAPACDRQTFLPFVGIRLCTVAQFRGSRPSSEACQPKSAQTGMSSRE
jgi:hypothetical protein